MHTCRFVDPSADYLGAVVYSAQSELALKNTELVRGMGAVDANNNNDDDGDNEDSTALDQAPLLLSTKLVFLAGGKATYASGCGPLRGPLRGPPGPPGCRP